MATDVCCGRGPTAGSLLATAGWVKLWTWLTSWQIAFNHSHAVFATKEQPPITRTWVAWVLSPTMGLLTRLYSFQLRVHFNYANFSWNVPSQLICPDSVSIPLQCGEV